MIRQGITWLNLKTEIPEIVYIKNITYIYIHIHILEWPAYFNQNVMSDVLQMLTPSGSGRCGGKDYLYAGDTCLPERHDDTTNKMYPVEHKTLPAPNNSEENEDILGSLKGKWVQYHNLPAASIGPLCWTLTLMSGRKRLQRRGKGQCPPKDLGLAHSPSLVKQLHAHPQQSPRPQPMTDPKYKKKLQIADPHP